MTSVTPEQPNVKTIIDLEATARVIAALEAGEEDTVHNVCHTCLLAVCGETGFGPEMLPDSTALDCAACIVADEPVLTACPHCGAAL